MANKGSRTLRVMRENKEIKTRTSWKVALRRDWQLYLLLLLPIAMVVIFNYSAYPGLRMVFMDYKPARGYDGSEWVGFDTFVKVFASSDFHRALRNSIVFNLADLIVGFPVPIILALILNELRFSRFKRVSQTILYLPHFLSWVIIGSVAYQLFRPSTGIINVVLMNLGVIETGIPFLTNASHWAGTYLALGVWQTMGWGTIIYLAAIASVNPEMHESAMIDGATRWKRMLHITLPSISGVIVTLLIINLGRIMGSNFERLDSLGNSQVREYQYQLAVYIYQVGLAGGQFSRSTAVNLFQSLVGLALVLLSDRVSKWIGEDGIL